jgi:hypothetical protein
MPNWMKEYKHLLLSTIGVLATITGVIVWADFREVKADTRTNDKRIDGVCTRTTILEENYKAIKENQKKMGEKLDEILLNQRRGAYGFRSSYSSNRPDQNGTR